MTSESAGSPDRNVALLNPLPVALAHYQHALSEVLGSAGWSTIKAPAPTVEVGSSRGFRQLTAGVRALSRRLQAASGEQLTVVLWPAFGLADPATWLRHRGRVWVVVHDARALRRQFGMGRLAAEFGGWASRHGVGVLTHSFLARQELEALGWRSVVVPHPVETPRAIEPGGQLVTVLGQWKPARSLEPLRALAGSPTLDGLRVVVGRGWPSVDGWNVDDRFVDEQEFESNIDAAACVVVPYERYFQSGVAVRALERLTPVVSRPHPFLASVFGDDWPGFVKHDDWSAAVMRARSVSRDDLVRLRQEYWQHCVESWRRFVEAA